jgi:pimeloyl-ACP methyl ester carboxylesterase
MTGPGRPTRRDFGLVFDRTGRVPPPPLRRLAREARSALWYDPVLPDPREFAPGGGHVVLVVPGFLNFDIVTWTLRRFLNRCGYRSFGLGFGVNIGPTVWLRQRLQGRLRELAQLERGPVSLVGLSLGGLIVRDLARACPGEVRQVITIASPFRLPTATRLEPLIRACAAFYDPAFDIARLGAPLPLPATAIYSRDDGLVAWQTCLDEDGACVNVEVGGAHLTICRNPATLRAVAQRLGELANH